MRLHAALCALALVLVEIKADGEMLRAISGKVRDKKVYNLQKSGNGHNSVVLSGSHAANDQDEDNNNDFDVHASESATHEHKSAIKKRDTSQKLQGHTHEHFNSIKERSLDETSDYIDVEPMHDVVLPSSKSSPTQPPMHLEDRNALSSGSVQSNDHERDNGISAAPRRVLRTHAGDIFVIALCYVWYSLVNRLFQLCRHNEIYTRTSRANTYYSLRLWFM